MPVRIGGNYFQTAAHAIGHIMHTKGWPRDKAEAYVAEIERRQKEKRKSK